MNLGKDAQKKKLLTFHKEELVEEIIKLMLCLKKTNSEKDEKENQLLREKLFDIREEIVNFAEWVDINLFR